MLNWLSTVCIIEYITVIFLPHFHRYLYLFNWENTAAYLQNWEYLNILLEHSNVTFFKTFINSFSFLLVTLITILSIMFDILKYMIPSLSMNIYIYCVDRKISMHLR